MYITTRQATLMFILFQIGSSILLIPSVITKIAKQDAWLSVPISIGLFIPCILLYAAIAKQTEGKSLVEHLNMIVGKWIGKALMIIFIVCVPLLILIMTLRNLSDFIMTVVMPETPVEIINALMLVAVYFVVRAGITVIGRSAEILFFIIPVLFVLNIASLLPSVEIDYLLPIFEYGLKPIIHASFPLLGFPYLECVVLLYMVPNMNQPQKWKTVMLHSTMISGSMYLIVIIISIAVLSAGVTSNLTFASYFVIRTISIADFIERFEILITVFWYISSFFRLSLLLFIVAHGLAEVFHLQEAKSLLIPLLLIIVAMTYWIWPNITFSSDFIEVYPWYAMVFGIVVPLLIWLIGKMRLRRSV